MRLFLLFLALPFTLSAQESKIKVSRWLNGCNGTYTIMHDDFCMAHASGISEYADSMAVAHGVTFDFPVVTNHCDSIDWVIAKEMISHGHEISNHSHNHYCGIPVSWCPTEAYDSSSFKIEYDLSTQLILDNTGQMPELFIFPFDLHTGEMHDYLMNSGYTATRSGPQSGINHPDNMDLKKIGFQVLRPDEGIKELNELVNLSIDSRQWGVRVTHGVNDASWGAISLIDYEAHMSYLESKMNSGHLWVATINPILEYIEARKSSHVRLESTSKKEDAYSLKGTQKGYHLTIQLITNKSVRDVLIKHKKIPHRVKQGAYYFNIPIGSKFIITYE